MAIRLGYLASGAASSAPEIHAAATSGSLDVTSAVLIGNNSRSGAIEWAEAAGVPAFHLSNKTRPGPDALDLAIRDTLLSHAVDLVILSGYAKRVGGATLEAFRDRILNVHPAPLPRFGGQGMYGMAVHEAVIAAGVDNSAVTIHLVNENYDEGRVLAAYPVPVHPGDSAESLRERVHDHEPHCWIELLSRLTRGEIVGGLSL